MTDTQPYNKISIPLSKILTTDNVATLLNDQEKSQVTQIIHQTYENDKTQSKQIMEDMENYMKIAMQITEPSASLDIKYNNNIPLMIKAAIRFNSDAFPALTKGGKIAKFAIIGNDDDIIAQDEKGQDLIDSKTQQPVIELEGGRKLERAGRLGKFFNWFIYKKMGKWVSDLDAALLTFSITGTIYRKTYFNPYTQLPCSELIYPNNIIINPCSKNMEDYPVSELRFYTQNELVQRMVRGEFIKYDLEDLIGDNPPEKDYGDKREYARNDTPIEVIEQHCLLDLDGDGYKEPYIVSICGSNKLLSIQKRFDENKITYKGSDVLNIEGINFYTPYIFSHDPRGSFHGIGFGFLLYKLNKTLNTSINQLLKAAYRANQQRGFFDKDKIDINTDILKLVDGEFLGLKVELGSSIKEAITEFPAQEPSAGLAELMTFLLDLGRDLSNINDIATGDFPANAAPGTVLAMIQQGMKEFKAIYSRIYLSLEKELNKIFEIIGEHPELYNDLYKRVLDDPNANFEEDFSKEDLDVMPAADMEVTLDSEKVAKANFLSSFIGNPTVNQYELLKNIFEAYRIENIEDMLVEPQPQAPDPTQVLLEQQQAIEEQKQNNEAARIKVAEAETILKTAKAKADTVKMDVEMDKMESEIELNRAKSIETLAKAGKESTLAKADSLYEPGSRVIANEV